MNRIVLVNANSADNTSNKIFVRVIPNWSSFEVTSVFSSKERVTKMSKIVIARKTFILEVGFESRSNDVRYMYAITIETRKKAVYLIKKFLDGFIGSRRKRKIKLSDSITKKLKKIGVCSRYLKPSEDNSSIK